MNQKTLTKIINKVVQEYGDEEDYNYLLTLKNSEYLLKNEIVSKIRKYLFENLGNNYTKKEVYELFAQKGELSFLL